MRKCMNPVLVIDIYNAGRGLQPQHALRRATVQLYHSEYRKSLIGQRPSRSYRQDASRKRLQLSHC